MTSTVNQTPIASTLAGGLAGRFAAAFNARDVETVVGCFTEAATYHDLFYGVAAGRSQIRSLFTRMYSEGEDHRWVMTRVVDTPECTLAEWRFAFTVSPRLPGGSRRLTFDGVSVFETTDGSCHAYREYFDRTAALLGLGIAPPAVLRLVERRPTVEVELP